MFRRKPKEEGREVEANLIPVLSCLFLLIPALLLAMEIAPFTAVRVAPPHFCVQPGAPQHGDPPLRLEVHVREDGFVTRHQGARAQPDLDASAAVDIPMGEDGLHDFDALELHARALKEKFPGEQLVTLSAEGSVEYGTLVRSMDALRGRDCSLRGLYYGEPPSADCYFWEVVVQSG